MLCASPPCPFPISGGKSQPQMLLQTAPPRQGSYEDVSLPISPSLTRLPAPLAHVGGHLVLGGPSLLQALWAVAVPIGICTQKRQRGLWDTYSLGLDSDRTQPHLCCPPQLQGPEASKDPSSSIFYPVQFGSTRHQESARRWGRAPRLTVDPQALTKGAAWCSLLPGISVSGNTPPGCSLT